MTHVVDIAAIEDNRMFADALRAWANGLADVRLVVLTPTVEELLRTQAEPVDVVLLGAALRAEPDLAANVRDLLGAGHRVVVIDGSSEPISAAPALAAGAAGYLRRRSLSAFRPGPSPAVPGREP